MNADYVSFGDVARQQMGQQAQYASRYFCKLWSADYTYCGSGLRIIGDSKDYHSMMIHKDDVKEAVNRYKEASQR